MRADFELPSSAAPSWRMERIAQEESRALQEVRGRAADLAIRATRRLLTDRVGAGEAQDLIQRCDRGRQALEAAA